MHFSMQLHTVLSPLTLEEFTRPSALLSRESALELLFDIALICHGHCFDTSEINLPSPTNTVVTNASVIFEEMEYGPDKSAPCITQENRTPFVYIYGVGFRC